MDDNDSHVDGRAYDSTSQHNAGCQEVSNMVSWLRFKRPMAAHAACHCPAAAVCFEWQNALCTSAALLPPH